jgi:vacuolar protein sorting-associated protein 29
MTLEYLRNLSNDYQAVKGEFDSSSTLPLNKVVTQGQLKIGIVAGHTVVPNNDPDALLIIARQLDVDILLWGGSHRVEAYQVEGKFFINPGSATGAFYTGWEEDVEEAQSEEDLQDPIPSFCLLDVQGAVCTVYIYSYIDGEVKVDKMVYRKGLN